MAVVFSVMSLNASVFELPTMVVDGVEYYYYQVKAKETIYSLSKQLGVSQEDMLKYNSSLKDGLKAGSTLYFPVKELGGVDMPISHDVKKGETVYGISKQYGMTEEDLLKLNPSARSGIKVGEQLVIRAGKKQVQEPVVEPVVTKVVEETKPQHQSKYNFFSLFPTSYWGNSFGGSLKIALLMPFMTNQESMSGVTRTYLDFYKGFLLAADELKYEGRDVNIYVYDTYGNIDSLENVLYRPEMEDMDVIMAPPGDSKVMATIASNISNLNTEIFNAFYAGDTTHYYYRNVIQTNIRSQKMYDKVAERIVKEYADYVPVIFGTPINVNRASFVSKIESKYKALGVTSKRITFTSSLQLPDLAKLDSKTKYLFIPTASSDKEIVKWIDALSQYRKTSKAKIALFGYPDWIVVNDATKEKLCQLNTVMYSRFYFDETGSREKAFVAKFNSTYKTSMKLSQPIQAALGYDCGYYLINALRNSGGSVLEGRFPYKGLQYVFDITEGTLESGGENQGLFMLYFYPSGVVERVPF